MFTDTTLSDNSKNFRCEPIIFFACGIIFAVGLLYSFFLSPPKDFPTGSIYHLEAGQSLSSISENFLADHIIHSGFWFKSFAYVFSLGDVKVIAGDYALYKNQDAITLAWRITHADFDIKPLKITIPEGLSSSQIADIFARYLPSFDKENFVNLVKSENLEGYLFPDTYFFMPDVSDQEIIDTMNANFNKKISTLADQIKAFGQSESDVIKMASILEKEVNTEISRRIVAGILWKRIALGMALQVDSSIDYIDGATSTPTVADLSINSPYNTYLYPGLPPTPISNPGLESIADAITPTKTPYLYFLSDSAGDTYYATTLVEQDANEAKYLK